MKKGYIIENYSISDKHNYIPPVRIINDVLGKYNGKFLVATPKAEMLSGTSREVTIIIEFVTVEKAKQFYESDDYKEFKKLYKDTTEGWISLAEEYINK